MYVCMNVCNYVSIYDLKWNPMYVCIYVCMYKGTQIKYFSYRYSEESDQNFALEEEHGAGQYHSLRKRKQE